MKILQGTIGKEEMSQEVGSVIQTSTSNDSDNGRNTKLKIS